jgi:superfamily II DNA or RNA helicase
MPHVPLPTGCRVRIRGEHWRVAAASSFERVSILDVDGCDGTNHGTRARFILPFERVDRIVSRSSAPRVVTLARWRRAACAMLASTVPHWASLRAAARARLTVLPFQLEPAIAVTRGDTCRVLIADEVGLGKTIQAGLIVAEAITRTSDARVLIVSPAGLREQWRGELQSRFGLSVEILDAEGVARIAAHVVPGVNPWSLHQTTVTSIDYIKRPEVMRSLEALTWDVVVFDEAHALAGRSDRATAAAALARRARTVVMLTATPHSGDNDAFARLCALGDLGNAFPLTTFHRTRADVGLRHGRRLTQLHVRPTDDEHAMHGALRRYVQRLAAEAGAAAPGASLVASILARRACSSAWSLARSLERRVALLADTPVAARDQLTFPFLDADTDEEPANELGVAGLRDAAEEVVCLRQLAELARAAAVKESKPRALRRLIRRAREPVLVFTEYRDTLQHLAVHLADFEPLQLHGGLSARERTDVLRRFTSGEASVLLATDTASEGLNLHYRCRLVVNLELPWTPLRLEQRIGRVDRLGQRRRVHAVQLVADGTWEESMVARLDQRSEHIHAVFAAAVDSRWRSDAETEAARLLVAKSLERASQPPSTASGPLVTFIKRDRKGLGAIWAFHLSCIDSAGHAVFETLGAFRDERGRFEIDADLQRVAAWRHGQVLAATSAAVDAWLNLAIRREEAMVDALHDSHARLSAALLQPGLFDRRAERAAAAQAARVHEAVERSRIRLSRLARWRCLRADGQTVLFGIAFRP